MALSLGQVYARSQWRVRAAFNGGNPSGELPTAFTITRADGGPTTASVIRVLGIDSTAVELTLSERLIDRVSYVVTWGAQSVQFFYAPPRHRDTTVQPANEDPEAEVFGIDRAWLSLPLGPDGDMQRRRGVACVQYDLSNRAVLKKNELVQAPDAGAGLLDDVNGPAGPFDLMQIGSKLETEFRGDDRVKAASVDTVQGLDGEVDFNGQVQTRATGAWVTVRNS